VLAQLPLTAAARIVLVRTPFAVSVMAFSSYRVSAACTLMAAPPGFVERLPK